MNNYILFLFKVNLIYNKKMETFFLGIGIDIFKDYLKDLLEYGTDSIFKMIDNLAKKYGEKDVIECFPEIYKEINDKILK